MKATMRRIDWGRQYNGALKRRDWQTCDYLLEREPPATLLSRIYLELGILWVRMRLAFR